MTSDTPPIPAPPAGWAIVPADDARLDCLPARPMYCQPIFEEDGWKESGYDKGDAIMSHSRAEYTYALPIEPQPWSLPAPPAGQAWHRQDWEEAMLPEGWRPLLLGETRQAVDEWSYEPHEANSWKRVEYFGPDGLMMVEGRCSHHRTRRPLPASQPEQGSPAEPSWQAVIAEAKAKEAVSQANNPLFSGIASQAEDEVGTWTENPLFKPLSMAQVIEGAGFKVGPPPTTDPKGEAGKAKAPLALLPPEALRQAAWAHSLGAAKYGVANWRENKVNATTYISAMMRHIAAFLDGEDNDAETSAHAGQPISHLANVIASANILIDAKHCGTLVDDRPKRPA